MSLGCRWLLVVAVAVCGVILVFVGIQTGSASGASESRVVGEAVFSTYKPGWDPTVECVSVSGPMFWNEPKQTTGTCTSPDKLKTDGLVQSYQVNDGPVTVWGLAPEGATSVRADGRLLDAQVERFFMIVGKDPSTKMSVEFSGPSVSLVYTINAAIPTSRYPLPAR